MPITDPEPNTDISSLVRPIHVVAAAIRGADGRFLLTKRRPGTHLAGCWEFPGGKREPGETPRDALIRELNEELGTLPTELQPLIKVQHTYSPEKTILLDVWLVTAYEGEPIPQEGQAMDWVRIDEMDQWNLPPADLPVIRALRFSSCYMITPPTLPHDLESFYVSLEAALTSGVGLVLARIFDFSGHSPEQVLTACRQRCRETGARLLIHSKMPFDNAAWGDGLHFTSTALMQTETRPVPSDTLLAASCHSLVELRHAESIGADFAVLSPVAATASHPGQEPLGWELFSDWANAVSLPVYALGGMQRSDLAQVRSYGGYGIAGIRLFFPETKADSLLKESRRGK